MKKNHPKKIITYLLIIQILFVGYGFSNSRSLNIDNGDCWFIENTYDGNFGNLVENRSEQNEEIYPKEAIKQALFNLKAYCCGASNIIGSQTPGCKNDKEKGLLIENGAPSKFFYDHLVDIGLRRLDAMENLLYPGLQADPIGKERRDFINQKGEQADGTVPTDIKPQFEKQRTINPDYILSKWEDGNYGIQNQDEWVSMGLQYSNRPLVNRYGNICEISAYIYGSIITDGGLLDYTRVNGYSKCSNLSTNIISNNINFTKSVVLKKANKILYDNVDSYVTKHLSYARLDRLRATIFGIVQAFNTVNKKVVQLIKQCS